LIWATVVEFLYKSTGQEVVLGRPKSEGFQQMQELTI